MFVVIFPVSLSVSQGLKSVPACKWSKIRILFVNQKMKKSPLAMQSTSQTQRNKPLHEKEALVKLLRWHFGHAQFRDKQLDAIQAVLSGHNQIYKINYSFSYNLIKAIINLSSFSRKRLLLFDANWRWKVNVLSNSCIGQTWNCTCCFSFNR